MKKVFALFLFILLSGFSFAQGNLQFNQVRYFPFTLTQVSTTVYDETILSVTVPTGKVLKIESMACGRYVASVNTYGGQAGFEINQRTVSQSVLPLWLPAGTYSFGMMSQVMTVGYYYTGYISAIEFNVVP